MNVKAINELGVEAEELFVGHMPHVEPSVVHDYFRSIKKEESCFRAFVALNEKQETIAGVCAQVCIGPLPAIPTFFKCGSLWGFWGEKKALTKVVRHAVCYLKSLEVFKILTYAYSTEHFDVLTSLHFSHSNALECNLMNENTEDVADVDGITIKYVGKEYDEDVFKHWKLMWEENGVTTFKPESHEMTSSFIEEARKSNKYQTIAAFDGDKLVGSACVNTFFGVEPCEGIGGAWAVYVHPEYRRRGIGTRITVEMERYFKNIGFTKMRLIYASENGKRIYQRKGFKMCNYVCLDQKEINECFESFVVDTPIVEDLFSVALPGQLKAVGSSDIKSKYTGEVFMENKSKMGNGFNINQLQEENKVAAKFDRLSHNWEDVVSGMRYEYVFEWIAKQYKQKEMNEKQIVLDLCCGVGLPGQTIRMLGYKGTLFGCDISRGMLTKAAMRGCFDDLFVQDVNKGLCIFEESVDVIIDVGSMELLDIESVVGHCRKALKKGGELWVSFQWDHGENPTEHQHIYGIKEEDAVKLLENNGFKVNSIDRCENAFYTPKPTPDGSVLLPVPYIFINATKI